MFKCIEFEKGEGIGRLTLNRPQALNALNLQTISEIEKALRDSEKDKDIKVIVITGKGRSFCVGADLKELQNILKDPMELEDFLRTWHAMMLYIENFPKATIARINGTALAGGLELSLACDLAVAIDDAKLGDQHANFGLVAGGGSCSRLPRLVGVRRAKQLLFTGGWINGIEAERIGLVNMAVPADQLDSVVDELATTLVNRSVVATRTMKDLVNRGMQADINTSINLELWATMRHDYTEDALEGICAFTEKRKPLFKGR